MLEFLIYAVSTIFTFVMGVFSKKLKWNETLPIPVQNIIVGIIVFGIFYLIKRPSEVETIINQIMLSIGGAGTAALSYDATKSKEEK